MEEEFIRNQEQMKPLEEKQEVSWKVTSFSFLQIEFYLEPKIVNK